MLRKVLPAVRDEVGSRMIPRPRVRNLPSASRRRTPTACSCLDRYSKRGKRTCGRVCCDGAVIIFQRDTAWADSLAQVLLVIECFPGCRMVVDAWLVPSRTLTHSAIPFAAKPTTTHSLALHFGTCWRTLVRLLLLPGRHRSQLPLLLLVHEACVYTLREQSNAGKDSDTRRVPCEGRLAGSEKRTRPVELLSRMWQICTVTFSLPCSDRDRTVPLSRSDIGYLGQYVRKTENDRHAVCAG